mmetsp:Transcript_66489/g.128686  ORF Transcript_66489/g.128686 Transcript_66489/m.128686 type:complete len:107 (-) Transcript_66489:2672-2992(-)
MSLHTVVPDRAAESEKISWQASAACIHIHICVACITAQLPRNNATEGAAIAVPTAVSYNSGTKGRKIMRFKWAAPWVFAVCQAEYCEDKQVKMHSRARCAVDRVAS